MVHTLLPTGSTVTLLFRLWLGLIVATTVFYSPPTQAVPTEPAFIAAGIAPNLLIVMDNSASMLDLAYAPKNGGCHDDLEADPAAATAYQSNHIYTGYFSTDTWYTYRTAGNWFEPTSGPASCTGSSGPAYTLTGDDPDDICLQVDGGEAFFQARGNFLNWLSASRFDMLKRALTGGKYQAHEHVLISEGRGCPGTRFIRQVRVHDVLANTAWVLPLGIRPLDGNRDRTTAIEVFPPQSTGFNLVKCRTALDSMPLADNSMISLQSLYNTCVESNGIPLDVPRAVDPSGRLPRTDTLYDLPAVLTDIQAEEQLGSPLSVMRGVIHDSQFADNPPGGILQEIAGEVRIGIMTFNNDGSSGECTLAGAAAESDLLLDLSQNDCSANSRDGGQVIVEIADGTSDHIDNMIAKINAVGADTWSPLAEAVFNAIGYFTQRMDMRIDPADFSIDSPPCANWCQGNNILVITDGVSTADLHPQMTTFASVQGQHDGTRDDAGGCPGLFGGTFLDDITAYGFAGHNIHQEDPFDTVEHFQNVRTYFLVVEKPDSQGTGECAPSTLLAEAAANGGSGTPYYTHTNGNIDADLKSIFSRIRTAAVSGAATTISSARKQGGGAVYQARFWPWVPGLSPEDPSASGPRVEWVGDVNALLIDDHGRLFEDTDASGSLNAVDYRVVFYQDPDTGTTGICSQELADDGTCRAPSKTIGDTSYLWSAAAWLAGITDSDITANRLDYLSDSKQRHIFTWNDLDNDGVVGDVEILPFIPLNDWSTSAFPVGADRAPVPFDFGVTSSGEVNAIITWVRGLDAHECGGLRSRRTAPPGGFGLDGDTTHITWRLGDVVHSTPTVVASPSENYHLRYQDAEYAAFKTANTHRRHVIYFGGNDGMVHAVNGGFYDEANRKFWRGYDRRTGIFSDAGPELGAELWAYVPYNLLPHLKELMRTGYRHQYFVDAPPRVFDVQIFDTSPDSLGHTSGWGTIMVIGMRLGGDRLRAQDIVDGLSPGAFTDGRVFTSAFMVFDISDPETPPRLLGEMTYDPETCADLAYTTATPVVVPIKTNDRDSDWFLVLGSGPTDAAGFSDQPARVGVLPLKAFGAGQAFRIPAASAWSHAWPGSRELTSSPNGFVSGMTAVDYDLESHYRTDALYFGTIEGHPGDSGGQMYRWVTAEGHPQNWSDPEVMFDAKRPITAPPGIGFDGTFYWLYFGTGRFFDARDKSDPAGYAGNCFFGIKEPMDAVTGAFTWAPVANNPTTEKPQPGNDAGARTLLPVDQIRVETAASPSTSRLHCANGSTCLPSGVTTFKALKQYIAGHCDPGAGCTGTDGWVLALPAEGERVLGPNTLLSGLLTFTTYQPIEDICRPEGNAFYYAVHYQTGTAFWEPVFTTQADDGVSGGTIESPPFNATRVSIGQGYVTAPSLHIGQQQGSQAFIGTGAGAIARVPLPNLPVKTTKSGRLSWRRY